MLCFDHPLSERIRNFIRIEHLFNRFHQALDNDDKWSHHVALNALFEIMDCSSRADLKLEILQELERQRQMAQSKKDDILLSYLTDATQNLQKTQQKFGQHIRENEWLMAVKQRIIVPGGTTPVELPGYYFWQKQDSNKRRCDLRLWSMSMMPTFEAIHLLLKILRKNSLKVDCQAISGSYQHHTLAQNIHLLSIEIPNQYEVIPEVSANKYFTHIRFLKANQENMRGKQTDDTIGFKMIICSFDPI